MATLHLERHHYQQLADIIEYVPDSKLAADCVGLYTLYLIEAKEQDDSRIYCTTQATAYKLNIKSWRVRKAKAELKRLGLVESCHGRMGKDGECKTKPGVKLLQL